MHGLRDSRPMVSSLPSEHRLLRRRIHLETCSYTSEQLLICPSVSRKRHFYKVKKQLQAGAYCLKYHGSPMTQWPRTI